jgi:exopolysaccharide biosynthesis polyprenyl glycosylphosphotransferase
MSESLEVGAPEIATIAIMEPTTQKCWQARYSKWLRWTDAAVIVAVVVFAQLLRFGSVKTGSLSVGGFSSTDYVVVSAVIAAGWVVALAAYRTRSGSVIGAGIEEYRRVWTATLVIFGIVAVVSTLFKLDIARGYLAIAFPVGLMALSGNRWVARKYIDSRRLDGEYMSSVLAVGTMSSVKAFSKSLAGRPTDGFRVVGVCVPGISGSTVTIPLLGEVPVFHNDGDIAAAVEASGADTVALTSGNLSSEELQELSWQLEKLEVNLVVSPGMVDIAGPRLTIQPAGGMALIHVDKPQYSGAKQLQKRVFDITFALFVLTIISPILLVAALAVKMTSAGPVFYRAMRIGLDGEPFNMIKFRSMVDGADRKVAELASLNEGCGVLFKIHQDPRVTPVGRFLRRYSIDELPQFINVLLGEMSVVGPRPPLPSEADLYDSKVRRRLLVRPGITGLWQVSGRSDLSWEESVRLDLSYVENWSMMSDLLIVAGTVRAVLRGSGAY